MEDDKLYLGPESPADLQWSQGAKNTRTDKEIDDIINLGTYLDDTLEDEAVEHDEPAGTPAGDTSEQDGQQAQKADDRRTSGNDRWESKWANREQEPNRASLGDTSTTKQSGPPGGDTASTQPQQPGKRLSGAQRRKLAREMSKTLPPRNNKRPAEQSPVGASAPKKPPPKNPYLPPTPSSAPIAQSGQQPILSKRQRSICCDIVRRKPAVFSKMKDNPQNTAIAVNKTDKAGVFSPQQCNIIIKIIMNEIISLPRMQTFGNEPFVPKFHYYKRIQGLVVFCCVDSQTVDWLSNLDFSKAVEGAMKVTILVERDFSKLILCRAIIPGPERSEQDIKKMLVLQNKEINFTRWVIKEKKPSPKGNRILILIDVPSLRTMKQNGMKLYFGLSKILFYVLSPGVDDSIESKLDTSGHPTTLPPPPRRPIPINIEPGLLEQFKNPSRGGPISSFIPNRNETSGRFQSPPREPDLRFDPPSKSQQPYRPVRSPPRSRSYNRPNSPKMTNYDKPHPPLSSPRTSIDRARSPAYRSDSYGKSQGNFSEYKRSRSSYDGGRSPPSSRDSFDRSRPTGSGGNVFERSRNVYEQNRPGDLFDRSTRDSRDMARDVHDVPRDIHDVLRDVHNAPRDVYDSSMFEIPSLMSSSVQFSQNVHNNPNFKPFYKR